ncbi:pilus assembly protein [Massilia orientalis]|uniref:Pilus assembly protein n=1 Tax=Massilia orientalis TaxID=3050128 RepID=A0ACC7M3I0_9BURK|nr:PilC/PilY family type IV pilus protein [Massilia sp. YIM B02787]
MIRSTLALALCASLAGLPVVAAADDIDIFTGASAGNNINPRILIVLDNTSNWARQSQQWPGGLQQGQSEARAISNLLTTLDSTVSLGLMEFVTGGNANDDGGFIRSAIRPLDNSAKTSFTSQLSTIYNGINSPNEKRNSHTPYGDLMYDVYNYFAGADAYSPGGVIASIADAAGYTTPYSTFRSPLTAANTCGKSFVIFIGNPNASGPASDSSANTALLNQLNGSTVSQLGLPNFTTQNATTTSNLGVTNACYANPADAAGEADAYAAQCSTFTEGCSIGAATANVNPIACPAGSRSYTVTQSVYHPATTSPGQPVPGTVTTATGTTSGYYATAADVPTGDHGGLTCPATQTTTNGTSTTTTTYSCAYTVGAAVGTATTATDTATAAQDPDGKGAGCYTGVGTAAGNWNPATTTDFGGLSCPTNSSCTYSGELSSNAGGCKGNGYRQVTVKQTATAKRQYTITQTISPTSISNTTTPPYTTTTNLGMTSQCHATPPASTSDYAASCTGTNISCTYNNTPTSTTLASCPAGTSAYNIVGTNTVLTDVPTGTTSTDTGPRNADEWSRLLHDKGVPVPGSTTVRSPVTTYTIDVYNAQPNATHTALLMSMAKAGGGKYFAAKNEQAILDALRQIIIEIQAVNTTFASTSLPVNATNRSQNENQVFIGMFRPDPDAKPRWFGNLKRYQLIASGANIELGDVNGKIAVNTLTGFVTPCAASYWTSDSGTYWSGLGINPDPAGACAPDGVSVYSDLPDGPQVEKGGAAEILRQGNVAGTWSGNQAVNRNMLTLSGTTLATFNTASTGLAANLVNFIQGADVNNEKGTGATTTTRPSIHGDVIHSRPLPVNYGGTTGVRVFYGANDGALHAVNANTGVEAWSFVAPEFFGRLQRLMDNSPLVSYPNLSSAISPAPARKDYFFDGSIGLYQNADNSKVWIFPAMRRGGRMLYGLDVTHPDQPAYKWKAGCPNLTDDVGCTAGMSGVGQTWSTPNVAFIKGYSTTTPVLVVGGGYDACEDADTASPSCGSGKGGFVYVLDANTGAVIRSFATDRGVVADVALVDVDNDGYPDYAYAADLGGGIYRVDFVGSYAGRTPLASESWSARKVAYTAGAGRKFLFAPALLAIQGKVYVALGSGDREHPLQSQYPYADVTNRFYVYLDDLTAATGTPATDMDAMTDYTTNTNCAAAKVLPNSGTKGWFMDLNQYGQGEQVVTSALIASGMITFSTNRPIPPDAASCSTSLGEARGYWVNLLNGSGAINVPGLCGGARSSIFVGGGLPPSPVKASSVPIGGKAVSVVLGAVQKGGAASAGASVSISPQRIRPAIAQKRKRVYTYTAGD